MRLYESLNSYLCNLYGAAVTKLTKKLTKLECKGATLANHLVFAIRCRNNKIVPKGFRVKTSLTTERAKRICRKAGFLLLKSRISYIRTTIYVNKCSIEDILSKLHLTLNDVDYSKISRLSKSCREKTYNRIKLIQQNKFNKLLTDSKESVSRTSEYQNPNTGVVNLSNLQLSNEQMSVLGKGLNYSVAPRQVPTKDIISNIEAGIKNLDSSNKTLIRTQITQSIRRCNNIKSNLKYNEIVAVKELRSNKDIKIVKADKGNAVVILNTQDYDSKIKLLLSDSSTYRPLDKDLTSSTELKIRKTLKSVSNESKVDLSALNCYHTSAPKLYGLPKIHKSDIPLRPIVSSIGSPTYKVAKFLVPLLSPLVGHTNTFVKNSCHFKDLVKNLVLNENDILVSFDVTSLFTCVPVDQAVQVLHERLKLDSDLHVRSGMLTADNLAILTKLCVENSYFQYNNGYYKQVNGTAMGSPLSPILANVYMEYFEDMALNKATFKPKVWLRYVDDTFVVWSHGKEHLKEFLSFLNNVEKHIKFTMEIEADRQLSFLDVLVKRQDKALSFSVFRKKTHTDKYLNYLSNHHQSVKASVVASLFRRARDICDNKYLKTELRHIRHILVNNGYPLKLINRIQHKVLNHPRGDGTSARDSSKNFVVIPFVPKLSNQIARCLRQHDITAFFTSNAYTLKTQLMRVKDPNPSQHRLGVYKIPCECGKCYIGQTSRPLTVRLKEHRKSIEKCLNVNSSNPSSAVANHIMQSNYDHTMLWDEAKVIASVSNKRVRESREALEISMDPTTVNYKDGAMFPSIWKLALRDSSEPQYQSTSGHNVF